MAELLAAEEAERAPRNKRKSKKKRGGRGGAQAADDVALAAAPAAAAVLAPALAAGAGAGSIAGVHPDEACEVCGSTGDAAHMLLCDGAACGAGYHMQCIGMAPADVPAGDWLCCVCEAAAAAAEAGDAAASTPRATAPGGVTIRCDVRASPAVCRTHARADALPSRAQRRSAQRCCQCPNLALRSAACLLTAATRSWPPRRDTAARMADAVEDACERLAQARECEDVSAVVGVMRAHLAVARVQDEGCCVLDTLYRCNTLSERNTAAAESVIAAVLAALRAHPADAEVQATGFSALAVVTHVGDAHVRSCAVAAGALAVVLDGMREHVAVARVQDTGCCVLSNIARRIDQAAVTAAIAAVVTAMRTHLGDA
jgi:hypothetical protein